MPQLQNQNTLINRLAFKNEYRKPPERLNKPFLRNSLVLKDPCSAAGHLDIAYFCGFTPNARSYSGISTFKSSEVQLNAIVNDHFLYYNSPSICYIQKRLKKNH